MEKEIRERFNQDLEVARKFMNPIHQKMDMYYEMYRNRWTDDETELKISDLYAYVETVVPILTNNRVRGSVKAEFPDYVKHAKGMDYILDHTYDTNNWDYKAQRIARMAEIYRCALAYTGFDPDANNGTGKLTIMEINPRWCYMDPAVTELEDSSFFIYAEPMRITKVKKLYPDKADKIGKKREESSFFSNEGKEHWFKSWIRSVAQSFIVKDNEMTRYREGTLLEELSEEEKRKNAVAFIHYWYRDDDDKWRVAYFADEVFLEEMENPFWHGKLPFDIYTPTEDVLSAIGIPMAEHIEYLNWEKNVLLNTIVLHAKKAVSPPRVYNASALGSQVTPNDIKGNGSDVIAIANPDLIPINSLVADLYPAPLPQWVDNLPERFDIIMDRITGVNDSFRGLSEATSGKEVQLKQEAAYTRIKTKVDNFERFNKSIAEKIIINAMQFIDTTQAFRVKGDYRRLEGEELPFEFEPIQTGMDENQQPKYDNTEFFLYANPNEWTRIVGEEAEEGEEGVQEAFRILQFTVEIEAGSSLPTSRMARREEALELFNAGVVDQQYLLEAYEVHDAEEIIARMQQAMQPEMSTAPPVEEMAPQPPQQDLASQIDQLRQIAPELANMTDEQIVQLLASMNGGVSNG